MTASIEMARGEMPTWSDLTADRPPAGGPALERLVEMIVPQRARVAVVGPHDMGLLARVVDRAGHCTVVVRSATDAASVAERFGDAAISVICGDVLATSTADPVDVVLAFDGLERTVSLEAVTPRWRTVFDHVRSLGSASAIVAVATDNPLSVDELAGFMDRGGADGNADWRVDELRDASRPQTASDAGGLLPGVTVLTAFPTTRHPTILSADPGALPAALVVAHTEPGGRPDRREATRVAAAAGRTAELAPGWLILAGVPTSPVDIVVDDAGAIVPVPAIAGATLFESAMLDAARARDTAGVRVLARGLADALRGADDLAPWQGIAADRVVVDDEGRFARLDPTGAPRGSDRADELAVACFDDVAERLFELGWRHPWPVSFDAAAIAHTLAAMADVELPAPSARRARDASGIAPAADASLLDVIEALRSRLAWFEATLDVRQRELATLRASPSVAAATRAEALEKEMAALRSSTSMRIGRAVLRPARLARRVVASLRRRVRR